jgi:CHASE1-domain containing sensor protein
MSERGPDISCHDGTTMRRRRPAWPVISSPASVAMAIGLVLSLAGAYAVSQWEERVTRIEFEGVADTQSIIMQNGMNEYVSRLVALRTLFESANEEITRSEFEAFAGRLFERHPGILRVAWLPRVNRKERAEYEAAAITAGISGYQIKSPDADGSITTAPQSDEYYPVFFSTEPKTSMTYGLDYAAAPSGGRRSNVRATTT